MSAVLSFFDMAWSLSRLASAVCDAVTEGQEAVCKVDVLKLDIRDLAAQLDVGKVPESLDTKADQVVRRILRHGLGDGQHHHIHRVALDKRVQLRHGADGDPVDSGADHSGGDIERRIHRKAALREGKVLQQGMSQIADADHDQMVIIVHAQNMADLSLQFFHIITVTLLSELAKAAEVLADLGGGDAHLLPQGMGGDPHDAAAAQFIQMAVISWKTPDNGVGDVFLFQKITPSWFGLVKTFSIKFRPKTESCQFF